LSCDNLVEFNVGHVFAFGETRATAIANMVLGLKELHIRGEIHTNVDYTVDLLHVRCYLVCVSLDVYACYRLVTDFHLANLICSLIAVFKEFL
jgi:hypothetical protein